MTQDTLSQAAYAMAHGDECNGRPIKTEKRMQAAAVRALCGDISDMTLWRWIDKRDFPKPTYIARRRFWREADVIAWLDAQAENAA